MGGVAAQHKILSYLLVQCFFGMLQQISSNKKNVCLSSCGGPLFVGAPVRPHRPHMPKSASGYE